MFKEDIFYYYIALLTRQLKNYRKNAYRKQFPGSKLIDRFDHIYIVKHLIYLGPPRVSVRFSSINLYSDSPNCFYACSTVLNLKYLHSIQTIFQRVYKMGVRFVKTEKKCKGTVDVS